MEGVLPSHALTGREGVTGRERRELHSLSGAVQCARHVPVSH